MAKNDDEKARQEANPPEQMAGGKAPVRGEQVRGAEQDAVEDPNITEPTPAVATILVDAGAAAREQDEDLYESYVGVDEDRKRIPASDAQRPYRSDEERDQVKAEKEQDEAFQREAEEAQQRDAERRQRRFDADRA